MSLPQSDPAMWTHRFLPINNRHKERRSWGVFGTHTIYISRIRKLWLLFLKFKSSLSSGPRLSRWPCLCLTHIGDAEERDKESRHHDEEREKFSVLVKELELVDESRDHRFHPTHLQQIITINRFPQCTSHPCFKLCFHWPWSNEAMRPSWEYCFPIMIVVMTIYM